MKSSVFLVVLQLALGAFLFWSCFCRMTRTDSETHREVRWAFLFKGVCSGMVAGAPFLPLLMPREIHWTPYTTPAWVWLMFLLSVTIVQVVTAFHWREGVPQAFQRGSHVPRGFGLGLAAVALAVGTMLLVPLYAIAQAGESGKAWQKVEGDVLLVPFQGEVLCLERAGCVMFTMDSLRETIRQANGTCGKIPALPGGRGT